MRWLTPLVLPVIMIFVAFHCVVFPGSLDRRVWRIIGRDEIAGLLSVGVSFCVVGTFTNAEMSLDGTFNSTLA